MGTSRDSWSAGSIHQSAKIGQGKDTCFCTIGSLGDPNRSLQLTRKQLNRKIDARERMVAFIPEYAAYIMNRLTKGLDGKVAYERIKGKKPSIIGIEFGEKVFYKTKPDKNKLQKINARWDYGIFVGVRRQNNELMIANQVGVFYTRSIKRIPIEKRLG